MFTDVVKRLCRTTPRGTDPHPKTSGGGSIVPLDPESPWPKFRCNTLQNGRSTLVVEAGDRQPWSYPTGKGIFSSPVIDSAGTVYIGSADHYFYALASDRTLKWRFATGDIIDSSALLDDKGRVYFGSGDGHVYCLDRDTGEEVWKFRAHTAAEVTEEYGIKTYNLNWFEGNVAMLPDGTILAGNDNYLLYALDREIGDLLKVYPANEMIWSCPAVNPSTGRVFFTSDFTALSNVFCFEGAGKKIWTSGGLGTVSASPMLTSDNPAGAVLVGGFDGVLRAFSQKNGKRLWKFGARDHIYGSPAQLSDGTVIQAACDGTVCGLDPVSGRERWSFDTLVPIRSSPAVDTADRIYVGAGDGHLYCLNGDGSFRWAYRCIDDNRNDLNGSPALGPEGVVIGGENGGIFFIPYDYPLTPAGKKDHRTVSSPVRVLPDDGARLFFVNGFGRLFSEPPKELAANEPVTLAHLVRRNGKTVASMIDAKSLYIMVSGSSQFRTEVSADRRFFSIIPQETWTGDEGDTLDIGIRCRFKTGLRRFGLKFFGGRKTESFDFSFSFSIPPRKRGTALPFRIPDAPGSPVDVLEISRFSCPNPTILPSYNQIGFDSLHYLAGFVEGEGRHAVLWAVQGRLDEQTGKTLPDPSLKEMYALNMEYDGGLVTLYNYEGFKLSFFGSWDMPFGMYRVSSSFDEVSGTWAGTGTFSGMIRAGEIKFYGTFLKLLGMADGKTGRMHVAGAVDLGYWKEEPVQNTIDPTGIILKASPTGASAEIPPGVFRAADYAPGILLVDSASGKAAGADYSRKTSVETDGDGFARRVNLDYREKPIRGRFRVYLMANTAPVCREEFILGEIHD